MQITNSLNQPPNISYNTSKENSLIYLDIHPYYLALISYRFSYVKDVLVGRILQKSCDLSVCDYNTLGR